MPVTHSQAPAHPLPALGEYDFRLPPGVLHHPHVPDPHPVREPRSHRLDDRLLGRKPHGDEPHPPLGLRKLRLLLRHQQPLDETLPVPLQRLLDPLHLEDIHPDPVDHARAALISAFMSRTAASSPANTAREMMACPMLSSTTSRIAATGCTLW